MTEQEPVPPTTVAPPGADFQEVGVASSPVGDGPAPHLADPDTIDTSVRTAGQRFRTFAGILVNTAAANITTSYLWFALTFWVYLQTRNVIATGVVG
ncbi:MAG: Major Facilitator Superfamily transporter, partial [Micrococcaceae bacterium]|nr:Major Facilitator Superfamily transporter [Micrococcaceae bacterium]